MDNTTLPTSPQSQKPASKNRMYPELIIPNNTHPNKLYAFPVIGLVIKIIILIPVFIISLLVGFVSGILSLITPFTILFKGTYWNTGYTWQIHYLTYTLKISLFLAGITDRYPGFTLDSNGVFEMHLPKPESPSRLLGFPVLGLFIRAILLIPYYIYMIILGYALYVAIIASWFGVWIKGSYPESLYEFIKDQQRVSLAYSAYIIYLSDTYPSFKISMSHKKIKIILLILGIILTVLDFANQINRTMHQKNINQPPYSYNQSAGENSSGYSK